MDVRIHAHPNDERIATDKRNAMGMFLRGCSIAEVGIYFGWRREHVESVLRQALQQTAALVAAQAKGNEHDSDSPERNGGHADV